MNGGIDAAPVRRDTPQSAADETVARGGRVQVTFPLPPIAELAHGLTSGLKLGGMAAVGKHFPGHGHIQADSHLELPVIPERPLRP